MSYSLTSTSVFSVLNIIRDLGVHIHSNLKFDIHVETITRKALDVLYSIFRSLKCNKPEIYIRCYRSYVLPIVEFASQVWSPYLVKDIRHLESVQRKFSRLLFQRCPLLRVNSRLFPMYETRLLALNIPSLYYRRVLADSVFAFEILKRELQLPINSFYTFKLDAIHPTYFKFYMRLESRINFRNSFGHRTSRYLTRLPDSLNVLTNSINFKRELLRLPDSFGLLDIEIDLVR